MGSKKNVLWVGVICGIIFAQGCSTVSGVGQDTVTIMDRLHQADEWVRENLW